MTVTPITSTRTRIQLADFGTGFIAGLAYLGYRSISVKGLDKSVESAFNIWSKEVAKAGLTLGFLIRTHEIHGDSPDVRRAVGGAVSRGVGFFTDTALAFDYGSDMASLYLKALPGDLSLWVDLAELVVAAHGFEKIHKFVAH
jgi:hypothetical protein